MPITPSPRLIAHCMPTVFFARKFFFNLFRFLKKHTLQSAQGLAQILQLPSVMDKRLLTSCVLCGVTLSSVSTFAATATTRDRWYRYYDNGIPTLSSSVSEQHMSHGYDVLDNHMQVIRHVQPFSTQRYDQQKVQREQAIEKQIADRHLLETYTSSDRAELQRDREVTEIDNQIKRGEQQSLDLTSALNNSISLAASYERANKPIPVTIKSQLENNRLLLTQSTTNVTSLKTKRDQAVKQFANDIAQLKRIERQRTTSQERTAVPNPQ